MSEEANIEKAPNRDDRAPEVAPTPVVDAPGTRETSAPVKARAVQTEVAPESVVVSAAQEPEVKPKRRTRKTADSAAAPAAPRRRARAAAESDDVEAPAKRRTRKAKAAAGDAEAPAATAEVMQARALAQISQASVVRRQRRAAERAAEVLSAAEPAVGAQEVKVEAPLIDPALRPHRRGRKPKAYVEAEKAAAAALAAQQAALMAARDESKADGPAEKDSQKSDREPGIQAERVEETSVESAQPAPASSTEEASEKEAAVKRDARPGRASRARKAVREDAPKSGADEDGSKPKSEEASDKADQPADKAEAKAEEKPSGKQSRRNHKDRRDAERAEGFRDIEGILDMDNQGFGYIRAHGYMPSRDDAFVPAQMIRAAGLRAGDLVAGTLRPMRANDKLPGLAKIRSVNGLEPEQIKHRPKFADLTPIYPNEPLKMEHGKDSITGRAIDIVSPIGKGQRGLIVSPPKAGKTTILKKICQSISINNPEVHLICLLVDERPEEVTDMQRSIKGDVVASTFDMPADNHTRVSELVIERAKRIVELGGDVVVVLDSITRLARAYNLAAPASGRILSGGVDSAALYPPKRFLGAARNIENGGSLTILASALVDTGSKMDEVIFEEFKGTGNMELKLDRDLADRRIFPAIDPVASGTRNEDLLVDEQMRPFMWGIRRILAGMNNTERAAASFIKGLKGTNSNQDFLIRTAKKAADHPEAL